MGSTPEFRKSFVARLKQACDESTLVPQVGQGRQQFIAQRMGLAPEAVSKWFKAIAMPRPDKIHLLAELLECDESWLSFGITPEMDRGERMVRGRELDGASHLVIGMISLAGGHCGAPSKTDPRNTYVDFYATMRGSVYPMHVSLGKEISRDHYEIMVPKEYRDVRGISVMPAGPGKFHFLDLPLPMIEEHKVRKAGAFVIPISRMEGSRYITGRDTWPRIKSFQEIA